MRGLQDFLWAAVFSTGDASVTLRIGNSQQTFSVGPGVSKLKIPTAPGQITVTLVRNGQTIINQTPNDFTFTASPPLCTFLHSVKFYFCFMLKFRSPLDNYNAYVGAASKIGARL
jgi:uncharacterized membrane protein